MLLKISKYPVQFFAEEEQEIPVRFAFAKIKGDTVFPLHYPVLCRDFLLDTLIWVDNPNKFKNPIYGYGFTGPISQTPTLLLKRVKHKAGLKQLHKIEELFSAEPSKLLPTEKKSIQVIVGDKKWQKNTMLLSFWTFCHRYLLGTSKYPLNGTIPETKNLHFMKKPPTFLEVAKFLASLPEDVPVQTSKLNYPLHGPNGFFNAINFPEQSVFNVKPNWL